MPGEPHNMSLTLTLCCVTLKAPVDASLNASLLWLTKPQPGVKNRFSFAVNDPRANISTKMSVLINPKACGFSCIEFLDIDNSNSVRNSLFIDSIQKIQHETLSGKD